jgi:hypothetical protein
MKDEFLLKSRLNDYIFNNCFVDERMYALEVFKALFAKV